MSDGIIPREPFCLRGPAAHHLLSAELRLKTVSLSFATRELPSVSWRLIQTLNFRASQLFSLNRPFDTREKCQPIDSTGNSDCPCLAVRKVQRFKNLNQFKLI